MHLLTIGCSASHAFPGYAFLDRVTMLLGDVFLYKAKYVCDQLLAIVDSRQNELRSGPLDLAFDGVPGVAVVSEPRAVIGDNVPDASWRVEVAKQGLEPRSFLKITAWPIVDILVRHRYPQFCSSLQANGPLMGERTLGFVSAWHICP